MHRTLHLALLALALTAGACVKLDTFTCAASDECVHDGVPGTCEADGLCSFPDTSCGSGKKYGEFAGPQSGQCVGGDTTVPATDTPSTAPTGDGTEPPGDTTQDATSIASQVSATTSDPSTDPSSDPTTDPTADPSTTTGGPVCSALGEACDALDAPCCSPCMTCTAGQCVAAAPEAGPAACGGACFTCGPDGECAAMPVDTACTSDCNQVVWQTKVDTVKTSCFSYADLPVASTCDELGQCRLPAPAACPDPNAMPGTEKLIAACDTTCLADGALCTPGGPAAAVTPATYCVLSAESAGCASGCTVDPNTMAPTETVAACDAAGVCISSSTACTGGLKCNPNSGECYAKCTKDDQCISNNCMMQMCQ